MSVSKPTKLLELESGSCKHLAAGAPALNSEQVKTYALAVPEWRVVDGRSIVREYSCATYMDGVRWFALVAAIAEQEDHHPDARVTWCKVALNLWTHTVGGLSENDFILAAKLERAWREFSAAPMT